MTNLVLERAFWLAAIALGDRRGWARAEWGRGWIFTTAWSQVVRFKKNILSPSTQFCTEKWAMKRTFLCHSTIFDLFIFVLYHVRIKKHFFLIHTFTYSSHNATNFIDIYTYRLLWKPNIFCSWIEAPLTPDWQQTAIWSVVLVIIV